MSKPYIIIMSDKDEVLYGWRTLDQLDEINKDAPFFIIREVPFVIFCLHLNLWFANNKSTRDLLDLPAGSDDVQAALKTISYQIDFTKVDAVRLTELRDIAKRALG